MGWWRWQNVVFTGAHRRVGALRDYASTLLAALVGAEAAAFMQIGDGAIVIANRQSNGWAYLFWPQHGVFANTTNFVTSKDASQRMDFDLSRRAN